MATGVELPNTQYDYMHAKWELPLALMSGVEGMTEKGEKYLPREPRESKEAYNVRLKRSNLYNVFKKTVTSASGLALSQPLVVSNVPSELEFLEDNATGDGRSITEIADEIIQHHLLYGKSHGVVDFPRSIDPQMSYADFKNAGFRPYINIIDPISLVNWDYNLNLGYPTLENIRITETEIVRHPENPWLSMDKKQIRVWYNNFVEVYVYDDDLGEFLVDENIYENTLGYIPLITGYSNKKGFLVSEPPLEDLAQVNLTHWQSSSDQRNILHVARVPFILATGFGEGDLEGLEIGSNRVVSTTSEEADMKYVEHTGQAISSGKEDLEDLEAQMKVLGADLIMGQSVDRQTATARQIDATESMSLMQLTIRSTLRMLENAYKIAGDWLGVDASGVTVEIGQPIPAEPNPTSAAVAMKDLPLTDEQIFEEAKRRGILSHKAKFDAAAVEQARQALQPESQPPRDDREEGQENNENQDDD